MRFAAACVLSTALLTACSAEETGLPPQSAVAEAGPATPPTAPVAAIPPVPAAPERRFLAVEGAVTLDGKPAAVGAQIGTTAHIETAKGGRAVITLQPGSAIEIREKSRLDLGSSARKKISLSLLTGVLWSILPKGQADYEVVAANAIAGVRGTTFFVDASKPLTYVCVCDGEVELTAGSALPRNVQSSNEHKGLSIGGKGKNAKLKDKGIRRHGHTDAEAEALMRLIPPP